MEQIKCVLVGDAHKIPILYSYTHPDTMTVDYMPCVFDDYCCHLNYNDKAYSFRLCDTACQEDYDSFRPLTYSSTNVFIICFSVVSPDTFDHVKSKWYPEITKHSDAPYILLGSNIELREDQETIDNLMREGNGNVSPITRDKGEELAKEIKAAKYMECSPKTMEGIKSLFDEALKIGVSHKQSQILQQSAPTPSPTKKIKKLKKSSSCIIN